MQHIIRGKLKVRVVQFVAVLPRKGTAMYVDFKAIKAPSRLKTRPSCLGYHSFARSTGRIARSGVPSGDPLARR
jgi:hypothetical protein